MKNNRLPGFICSYQYVKYLRDTLKIADCRVVTNKHTNWNRSWSEDLANYLYLPSSWPLNYYQYETQAFGVLLWHMHNINDIQCKTPAFGVLSWQKLRKTVTVTLAFELEVWKLHSHRVLRMPIYVWNLKEIDSVVFEEIEKIQKSPKSWPWPWPLT